MQLVTMPDELLMLPERLTLPVAIYLERHLTTSGAQGEAWRKRRHALVVTLDRSQGSRLEWSITQWQAE